MTKLTKREIEYRTVLKEEKTYLAMRAYELAEAPADTVERLVWREADSRYIDLRSQWWAIYQLRTNLGIRGDVYRIAALRGEAKYAELCDVEEQLEDVTKKAAEKRRADRRGDI